MTTIQSIGCNSLRCATAGIGGYFALGATALACNMVYRGVLHSFALRDFSQEMDDLKEERRERIREVGYYSEKGQAKIKKLEAAQKDTENLNIVLAVRSVYIATSLTIGLGVACYTATLIFRSFDK